MSALAPGTARKHFNGFLRYAVLITVALFLISPVFFMVVGSLKLDSEYMTNPIRVFPKTAQWGNYGSVFTMTPFARIAARTGLLALAVAALVTISSSMAGYAFARYQNVPGSKAVFATVIAMLILPGIVILIPQFILYSRLKLTNTYWPWILGAAVGAPFYIFMFRQFFLGFPKELEDAAEVDGCGPLRVYGQIFMPNSKPVIATVMIFAFSGVWGDYLTPLIYLNSNRQLLGVALARAFRNPQGFDYKTISLAANVVYVLPLVIVFFLAQKHILRGVVTSGLKG
jgi:ABC-type glycerol-3-phosphate transport system permease component